ncbi:MAG: bacteriohemerythrin [Nitrospirae bacterium]|nr:bacteriohemerythrin [Nitrospirota bacterium]
MKIRWEKSFTTGIKEIDDQHKEIVLLMGKCLNLDKLGKSEIRQLMKRAEKHFVRHFETEEKIMKQYCYFHLRAHTAQHKKFKKELNDLREILESEGASLRFSMLVGLVMSEWLTDHFRKEDGDFSVFILKRKGSAEVLNN